MQVASAQVPVDHAYQSALQFHQAGDLHRAAEAYRAVLDQEPRHARAWHLLGVACHQRGQFDEAAEHIRRAIVLDDGKAVYQNNYGVTLRALGRLSGAEQAFRRALTLHPHYADAHSNLGVTLHDLGQFQAALPAFERALQIRPDHPDALFNLGNLLRDLGRDEDALRTYRKALAVRPNRPEVHNNLGNTLLAQEQFSKAAECYRQALALAPQYAEAHLNLGAAFAEQEMVEEAAVCFEKAGRLRPDKPLWPMRTLSLCPAVFQSNEEIDSFHRGLGSRLDEARQRPLDLDWNTLAPDGFSPSFYLAHHGRDIRPLKEKFAALFEPYFPRESPPLKVRGGKARIGFLATQKHEGGFLRCLAGVVERLDAQRFQPVVLCSESVLKRCRQGIQRADVEFVGFSHRFGEAAEHIKSAQCDVLYHWQIGTDPLNYLLPFARLAPVQCTGWGTHVTSGIGAVDHYLSSDWFEPEGAQSYYTETLHRFGGFPAYLRRTPKPLPAQRADFGLPERGILYICPERLAKFHPDFDALIRGVLETDPHGYFVLPQGKHRRPFDQLIHRWQQTLGDSLLRRVIFYPAVPNPAEFYRLLSLADVMLDAPHYSAGLTAYDAFSLHLPVVTLPGKLNVSRYVCGFYGRMGITELVSRTPDEYIRLAVRLGTDREYREAMRSLTAERSELLFEDQQAVREHEQFFEQVLSQSP